MPYFYWLFLECTYTILSDQVLPVFCSLVPLSYLHLSLLLVDGCPCLCGNNRLSQCLQVWKVEWFVVNPPFIIRQKEQLRPYFSRQLHDQGIRKQQMKWVYNPISVLLVSISCSPWNSYAYKLSCISAAAALCLIWTVISSDDSRVLLADHSQTRYTWGAFGLFQDD